MSYYNDEMMIMIMIFKCLNNTLKNKQSRASSQLRPCFEVEVGQSLKPLVSTLTKTYPSQIISAKHS